MDGWVLHGLLDHIYFQLTMIFFQCSTASHIMNKVVLVFIMNTFVIDMWDSYSQYIRG